MASKVNDPVTFKIIPKRIGRHPVEPFEIGFGSHTGSTASRLADRLHTKSKEFLLSKEFYVDVDLKKGTFSISGGRLGSGEIIRLES